jgi:hypothetical protein
MVLGIGDIVIAETNGALEPHDPRRSCPERNVHGFALTVISTASLAIAVIAAAAVVVITLIITTVIVLRARDNLLSHRWWDHLICHQWDLHPNLITHPPPLWSWLQGGGQAFINVEGSHGDSCRR